MKLGIVGLPNVGKSTLFNAITRAGAQAANYPFCTIEPNTGVVPVPDKRLDELARMYQPKKVTPATVEFVDIAGLVKGASRGEGLGNKFLSHIREVDPRRDIEVIDLELILADLETVERRTEKARHLLKNGDKLRALEADVGERLKAHLEAGKPARTFAMTDEEREIVSGWFLLKPVIYAANIADSEIGQPDSAHVKAVREIAQAEGSQVFTISAQIEEEIAQMEPEEKDAFLTELGLGQSGLDRLTAAG